MTLNRAWDRSQRSAGGFVRPAEPRRSLQLALAPRADVLRSTHPRSGVGPGFLVHDRPARPGKAFARQIRRPAMPRVLLIQDLRRSVELGSRRTRVPARRISPGDPGTPVPFSYTRMVRQDKQSERGKQNRARGQQQSIQPPAFEPVASRLPCRWPAPPASPGSCPGPSRDRQRLNAKKPGPEPPERGSGPGSE